HQHFVALFVTNVRGPRDRLSLGGAPLGRAWPVTPLQGNVRLGGKRPLLRRTARLHGPRRRRRPGHRPARPRPAGRAGGAVRRLKARGPPTTKDGPSVVFGTGLPSVAWTPPPPPTGRSCPRGTGCRTRPPGCSPGARSSPGCARRGTTGSAASGPTAARTPCRGGASGWRAGSGTTVLPRPG